MKILHTSDWHAREDVPRCRNETEEQWVLSQKANILEVIGIAEREGCSHILNTGDVFHRSQAPTWFINTIIDTMRSFKGTWVMMPGNHDLYKRDPDLGKTAYGVIEQLCKIGSSKFMLFERFCAMVPYGTDHVIQKENDRRILGIHEYLQAPGEHNEFVKNFTTPRRILTTFPNFNIFLVGDNHIHFWYGTPGDPEDGVVLNPGCLNVQDVSFKGKPRGVFVLEIDETNWVATSVTEHWLTVDDEKIVDDTYIIRDKARIDRLEELADQMASVQSDDDAESLDFDGWVRANRDTHGLSDDGQRMIDEMMA